VVLLSETSKKHSALLRERQLELSVLQCTVSVLFSECRQQWIASPYRSRYTACAIPKCLINVQVTEDWRMIVRSFVWSRLVNMSIGYGWKLFLRQERRRRFVGQCLGNIQGIKIYCTYLLTPWCSPSWEANWFAASQEISRISRNPKVHYNTHKLPPTVSMLGQPNPVHTPTSHLLEIHPNIIHPSKPRSHHWSLFLRFPHQDPIHPSINHRNRSVCCTITDF